MREAEADHSVTPPGSRPAAPRGLPIRKAAVLGAGNMGSRIAAHFANAGIPVVLLDLAADSSPVGDRTARNRIVQDALRLLKASKPAAFYEPGLARLIAVGNFDDDLEMLRDCDWIVEAVAENLAIKRSLLAKVAPFVRADAIVTTNTSGLPVALIAQGSDTGLRRRWFGTHFFNPPRYMRLLEVIPIAETDPAVVAKVSNFAEKCLGKTVVESRDTPNFIANRIGIFVILNVIRLMQRLDLTIEQVDELTGSVLGWPKTGTFRLSDMVGLDVLADVACNFFERIHDERSDLQLPEFLKQMVSRKWLGDKASQGFYKKTRGPSGEDERFALDWKTLEYHPSQRAKFPALELAKNAHSIGERFKLIMSGDPQKDQASAFYWQLLPELWNYAAHRIGEVADDVVSIDLAMKAGFNWELGPFSLWDAVGFRPTAEKMVASGMALAPAAQQLFATGAGGWYQDSASGTSFFDPASGKHVLLNASSGRLSLLACRKSGGIVQQNPGASLIDLGDGVAAIELHSKMNAIGGDILSLVRSALDPSGEAVSNFDAFVIATEGQNFSVGANLMQLLLAIQEQEWDELDHVVRSFQKMTQAIKFCPRPVVIAPSNLCLGGGAEILLHGAARQAHVELYTGLVETGVGLVPAGGGCKEMLLKVLDAAAQTQPVDAGDSVEVMDGLRKSFEMIAMAKVSTSAAEAKSMGFLLEGDGVTANRDRLLADAKRQARSMADSGYAPPVARTNIPAPGESVLASLKLAAHLLREGEFISDYDARVAGHLAHVLCGGSVPAGTPLTEQFLLDLEREAFLSLCGEKKTAERVAHTLKSGKPLRN